MSSKLSAVFAALSLAVALPTAAQQQPIVLKFGSPAPAQSVLHPSFTHFIEEVGKLSNGTVKIEPYFGAQLGNFNVMYDRVVDGVADFGFLLTAQAGGKFKLHDVASLPFETDDGVTGSVALWNMYAKGITSAEYTDVRPAILFVLANGSIFSRVPIKSLEDMKGKKMSAYNIISTRAITALGAAQVGGTPADAYQMLSRGLIDASVQTFGGLVTFRLHEVTKHQISLPLTSDPAVVLISKKRWDSLPEQARAAIDRAGGMAMALRMGNTVNAANEKGMSMVKGSLEHLSPAETARWKKAIQPVLDQWVKETPGGDKVLAAYRSELRSAAAAQKQGGDAQKKGEPQKKGAAK
jgi:TRAP-type transport system periplasmic protein